TVVEVCISLLISYQGSGTFGSSGLRALGVPLGVLESPIKLLSACRQIQMGPPGILLYFSPVFPSSRLRLYPLFSELLPTVFFLHEVSVQDTSEQTPFSVTELPKARSWSHSQWGNARPLLPAPSLPSPSLWTTPKQEVHFLFFLKKRPCWLLGDSSVQ
ncbi:hypothetical protein DPEC_G00209350, partial [Dallia pectoralis]